GFQATNQVTVKLRDPTRISTIIDRLVTAGANNIGGIDFRVSDPGKAIDKVRGEAIRDARRKAELYAEAAGRKLGRVVTVTEGGGGGYRPPLPMARAGAAVPVMTGEETLSVSVTVTFELQ